MPSKLLIVGPLWVPLQFISLYVCLQVLWSWLHLLEPHSNAEPKSFHFAVRPTFLLDNCYGNILAAIFFFLGDCLMWPVIRHQFETSRVCLLAYVASLVTSSCLIAFDVAAWSSLNHPFLSLFGDRYPHQLPFALLVIQLASRVQLLTSATEVCPPFALCLLHVINLLPWWVLFCRKAGSVITAGARQPQNVATAVALGTVIEQRGASELEQSYRELEQRVRNLEAQAAHAIHIHFPSVPAQQNVAPAVTATTTTQYHSPQPVTINPAPAASAPVLAPFASTPSPPLGPPPPSPAIVRSSSSSSSSPATSAGNAENVRAVLEQISRGNFRLKKVRLSEDSNSGAGKEKERC